MDFKVFFFDAPLIFLEMENLLQGVKLVIFDYDGIIYDIITPLRETVIESVEKFGLKSLGLHEDMAQIFRILEFALTRSVADQILDSKEMLNVALLEEIPHLKRLRIATSIYGDFRSRTKDPILFDGIQELIPALTKRKIKVAILSNSAKKYITATLEQYQLLQYFSTILGAAEVTKVKPDPEGLNRILAIEKVTADQTLFIGDMVSDLDAGKNARIRTIAVASGILTVEKLRDAEPFALVMDIPELRQLFGV